MTEKNKTSPTEAQVVQLQATIEYLQEENHCLREQVRHADSANKAKSDFLAMISHEIRTPMNGVIGLSELLLGTELESRQKHFAELILASARNLLTLINSLLDFSKIEAQKMTLEQEIFDLKVLLDEVMELFVISGQQKNLLVSAEIDPQIRSFYVGDGYRLRQVLVNLLGNAVKFTDQGEVRLKLAVVQREEGQDLLRFEVRDSGSGIPRQKQKLLFQPFTQLEDAAGHRHSGTGLGLSICARLIELMEGSIGLHSMEGEGSTFWFQVSLRAQRDPVPHVPSPCEGLQEREKGTGEKKSGECRAKKNKKSKDSCRVLIVDDDPTNRMVLAESLQQAGFEIIMAVNGREAVACCGRTEIDLVVMDCQMPVMDGFEATVELKKQAESAGKCAPPVVALTADVTLGNRQRCRDVGMVDYLLKPVDFDKLCALVERFFPERKNKMSGRHRLPFEEERPEKGDSVVVNPAVLEELRQNIGDISPVIKVFLLSLPGRVGDISEAVRQKDFESLARCAHTLKGSSSQFGADEIAALCRGLEKCSPQYSSTRVETLIKELEQAAERLCLILRKHLE